MLKDEDMFSIFSYAVPPLSNRVYNNLIYYVTPFILWINRLENKKYFFESDLFQEKILSAICLFEKNLSNYNNPSLVQQSTYCLCAFMDERLMLIKPELLIKFRCINLIKNIDKRLFAGEVFFEYLENALEIKEKSMEFIQFIYLLLGFGYRGKYFNNDIKLNDIKKDLLTIINKHYASDKC